MAGAARKQRRGDPKTAESARKLLRATADLMCERDTLDISFVEIADRAELPPGLISYYFGNKEGLYYAVLEDCVGSALQQLDALLKSGLPPAEKMRMHLFGVVIAYFRTPFFHRLLQMMTRDAAPERVAQIADNLVRPMTKAQEAILDEGVAAGVFRPVDKTAFYLLSVGAADNLNSSRFILNSVFNQQVSAEFIRGSAEEMVEIFMRGVLLTPDA